MSESPNHNNSPQQKPALSVIVCRGRNKNYLEVPKVPVDHRFDLFTPPPPKRHPLGLFRNKSLKRFERLYQKAKECKDRRQGRRRSGFAPLKDNTLLKLVFNVYEHTAHSQITRLIGKIARSTGFALLEYTQITPVAYEVWFFTLDLKSGKQLARYSEALSKENLMRFQSLIYEVLDPKTEMPEQGMFISSKEYSRLTRIEQEHQDLQAKLKEVETDTTEFIDALEEWLFFTQLTNANTELEYLWRFCEKANPFMKKYFGSLIGLKEFGGQKALSYSNLSVQELERIKREKRGFGLGKTPTTS
ncbi:hypothetical protein [Helicobacter ailurogastricus]|uniref:hypothetical protein n=1 Tax=Helicobacter ailurogastricus TaxID=1578720 RepID=UPI000CF0BEC9|nr:hypothetical protein [Helicobacter ailurogastricus]